ncbi:site-specific integrase [Aneurinibacillus sp. Ricciae_BoGa-3]|uniref:site-specific integrase n=1 Tax=Aneurinibacillus sp. Ricciae_BoGa-3 TaxID=3022697 RepID=UPI002340C16F|nr:site-specific integrase [Aneurinibacillus sp. Ricciae_BoGa-3]WCK55915.1 site-specific integrase [Aneurinibacillus sp. Ricciae_BoGa-3]
MSVVLDREITWFQQLKGNIVDEILAITDGKGRSGWEKLDKNFLWYFVRNCAGFPWANHLALSMVVRVLNNNDYKTIQNSIYSVHPRLKDLFDIFDLSSMEEFDPDKHMYDYLTKEVLKEDSDSMRASFHSTYTGNRRIVESWLRTKCDDITRSKLMPYLLPSFTYSAKELGIRKKARNQAIETRKNETNAIVPVYPQIRAEAHLRWNQLKRLRDQYTKVLKEVQTKGFSLPLDFNYYDKDPTDKNVKYVEQFHFRLWDKRSFVLAHQEKMSENTIKAAQKQTGAYSYEQNEYFLEFIKAVPLKGDLEESQDREGLWFLELLKEGVLGTYYYSNDTEIKERKKRFLLKWGYGVKDKMESYPKPFESQVAGVLSQPKFISENQGRSVGVIFSPEPFYVAATFGLTAIDLITTTGARINEVLQITPTKKCLVITNDTDGKKPITRYLFRVIPKGRTEHENFYMTEESFKLISDLTKMLKEHYTDGNIPRIAYQGNRGILKGEDGIAPYLFQYNGQGLTGSHGISSCMRYLLHRMIFQDQEGNPIIIKAHLLRHAFANHLQHAQKVPIDIIAKILHQKDTGVTEYYAEATDSQVAVKTHELHQIMATYIHLNSSVVRGGEELIKALEERRQKVGTFTQVVGGICSVDALCPVKMACVGCGGKIPTPEKKDDLIEYKKWAEESLDLFEQTDKPLEVQKMKAVIRDADKELYEIELIEQYRRDEQYEPELRINSKE